MASNSCTRLLLILCLLATSVSRITAAPRVPKPSKITLHFLARGSAIYSSFSGSQAEYLIEINGADKAPHLARLIYRHPLAHPEIPDTLIDSGKLLSFSLYRSTECDEEYKTLATRWLPGEHGKLRASNSLWFISGVNKPDVGAEEILPCYLLDARNVHWYGKSIRID